MSSVWASGLTIRLIQDSELEAYTIWLVLLHKKGYKIINTKPPLSECWKEEILLAPL